MSLETARRTAQQEILDDFEFQGPALEKTLKDLERVNWWLGGNRINIEGISKILKEKEHQGRVHIADVGCASGEALRKLSHWGARKGMALEFTGIDANPHAIAMARKASREYPEIQYRTMDMFSEEFEGFQCDILLCSLTLHHFRDEQIKRLLDLFHRQARLGVVINDLHRSRLAYWLFQVFCWMCIDNEIARKDGLLSILRGFKRKELEAFSRDVPRSHHDITWRWAFRYAWIIHKI